MDINNPYFKSERGVIYSKTKPKIIYIANSAEKLIIPPQLKDYTVDSQVKELQISITPGQAYNNIRIYTTSVDILHFQCGENVYTLDISEAKNTLFEHVDLIYRLQPRWKEAIIDLISTVIFIISSGKYDYDKLGEVRYLDRDGCGSIHIASVFGLRIAIAEMIAKIYSKNSSKVIEELIRQVVDNLIDKEYDTELFYITTTYFKNHPEQINALDTFPHLKEIAENAIKNSFDL